MKYYPHLWNTFKFLVTPDELRTVLDGFHHVAFTHRVPANYVESDQNIYFGRVDMEGFSCFPMNDLPH